MLLFKKKKNYIHFVYTHLYKPISLSLCAACWLSVCSWGLCLIHTYTQTIGTHLVWLCPKSQEASKLLENRNTEGGWVRLLGLDSSYQGFKLLDQLSKLGILLLSNYCA